MFVSRNQCDLIAWFDDSAEACSEIELQDLFLEKKKRFSFLEKKDKKIGELGYTWRECFQPLESSSKWSAGKITFVPNRFTQKRNQNGIMRV